MKWAQAVIVSAQSVVNESSIVTVCRVRRNIVPAVTRNFYARALNTIVLMEKQASK